MTILGFDASEHQDGLSFRQAKAEGLEFVIIRTNEGDYADPIFKSHLDDAEANDLPVAVYWYLHGPNEGSTIAQQVDVLERQLEGRKDLMVWIDVEAVDSEGNKILSGDDVKAAIKELETRGYRYGIYTGAWYWENMVGGEPSTEGMGPLWVSCYNANLHNTPGLVYHDEGADAHSGWSCPIGGRTPDILQYSSRALIAGFKEVDVNAFRGTISELREMFYGKTDSTGTIDEAVIGGTFCPAPAATDKEPTVSDDGPFEKVLEYSREWITQDTFYNCGPASTQTVILAKTGDLIGEYTIGKAMGGPGPDDDTDEDGTDDISYLATPLQNHIPGFRWETVYLRNSSASQDEIETLWGHLTNAICDLGVGMPGNFDSPEGNHPVGTRGSTSPDYRGHIMHYIAAMGVARDEDGSRHVWVADSGFPPITGYWMSLEQFASIIAGKGYLYPVPA